VSGLLKTIGGTPAAVAFVVNLPGLEEEEANDTNDPSSATAIMLQMVTINKSATPKFDGKLLLAVEAGGGALKDSEEGEHGRQRSKRSRQSKTRNKAKPSKKKRGHTIVVKNIRSTTKSITLKKLTLFVIRRSRAHSGSLIDCESTTMRKTCES
jgi:hypothetical protein